MAMRSSSNISSQLTSRWGSDKIYSVYLHVSSSVKLGQSVDIDKAIATVHKYDPNNSHLHWEIRRYASMMDAPISAKCKTKSLEVGLIPVQIRTILATSTLPVGSKRIKAAFAGDDRRNR